MERFTPIATATLGLALAAGFACSSSSGCKTAETRGPAVRPGTGVSRSKAPDLAPTPDIYTPPAKGRWTLRLVWFVEENPEAEEPVARLTAEGVAKGLREHGFPVFILTRSMVRPGSSNERLPVYYVCVGAFDSIQTEEARNSRAYFQPLVVGAGGEQKQLFKNAQFVLLHVDAEEDVDALLSLYEAPANARWGLVVGLFQGPEHKALARACAINLRTRGLRPLIQQSEVASRVLIGLTEFENDRTLARLKTQFPRVEHNLVGYVAFRGTYDNADHGIRARATARDLQDKGYDAFVMAVSVRPPGAPRNVTVAESRVYVVRKEKDSLTLDQLRREYREVGPHEVAEAAYQSSAVRLDEGAWNADIRNPRLTVPGRR